VKLSSPVSICLFF